MYKLWTTICRGAQPMTEKKPLIFASDIDQELTNLVAIATRHRTGQVTHKIEDIKLLVQDYVTQEQQRLLERVEQEVIGKDEKLEGCKLNDPDFEAIGYDNHHATLRNEFRAEQRERLTALKKNLREKGGV